MRPLLVLSANGFLGVPHLVKLLLLVGCGSAMGGMLRYLSYVAVLNIAKRFFNPQHVALYSTIYGTCAVNIIGGLLIGLLFGYPPFKFGFGTAQHALLMAGMLGGFTTFSSFSLEIYQMLARQAILPALSYSLISVIAALLATSAGIYLSRLLFSS